MATKQAKIHFLATKGPTLQEVPGSNAIIIQDYDEDNDKYVYGMIDVGYWRTTSSKDTAAEKARKLYDKTLITKYLTKHKITTLEFVLITHYHVDHFRGLKYLLEPESDDPEITIKKLILPMNQERINAIANKLDPDEVTDMTNAHDTILGWCDTYNTKHPDIKKYYFGVDSVGSIQAACNIGMGTFTFYNTSPLSSLYPTRPSVIDEDDAYNWSVDKFSIVTLYEVDGKKIVSPADIHALTENFMLDRPKLADCDVIQISHHGSHRGSCQEFVDFVTGGDESTKTCAAIQLRSYYTKNPRALEAYLAKNKNGRIVRVYGVWQHFEKEEVWNSDCSDENNASIVLEIRDGNIRYCSRRFVNTTKGYDQRTIPESSDHNMEIKK